MRLWYALLRPWWGCCTRRCTPASDPELAGIPFFYWYQFAWVLVAAVLTLVVYSRRAAMSGRAIISEAHETDATALVVFVALFALVTVLGFVAARWRRAKLDHLDEWGLGGRRFGTVDHVVPARRRPLHGLHVHRRSGARVRRRRGRLLRAAIHDHRLSARVHGDAAAVDRSRARTATSRRRTSCGAATASRTLALVVALTGLLATMPYIALQLVGMQVVLAAIGVEGDWPLIIAFVILAAYTYQSGLRAPALIAIVKDTLIYITILVAVIYIPSKLGGFGGDLRRGRGGAADAHDPSRAR